MNEVGFWMRMALGRTVGYVRDRWRMLAGLPVLLTAVYSTCHWCHVMEKESFSNPEIAAVMNRYFVSIKVDREERPDIDEIYMSKGYKDSFVSSRGGFGGAPKFPMPVNQTFLLRYYARSKEKRALDMVVHTLKEMAKGGIYDQVGGGFHRYSTDDKWHIPHFEKMLYDNAQLAANTIDAYQITKDPELARVARETLEYVLRDMTHPGGAFYSAEDADSLPPELVGKVEDVGHEHRSEGAFYIWSKGELTLVLGKEAGEMFSYRYGAEAGGNAESDPQGEFKGKNILFAARTIPETARKFSKSEPEAEAALLEARAKLLAVRAKRPRPHLDDKVLSDWNGLMISAFARAAQVLDDPNYLRAGEKAARFIRTRLYDEKENRLYRRWREGERKVQGLAIDYVLLTQGLIDLYEASLDADWLRWAVRLSEAQLKLFYDAGKGGFYQTAPGHDKNLLLRSMDDSDNVIPAASSVAALNFLRLAQFTGRKDFREAAEKTLTRFGAQMKRQPRSLPQMLVALDYALSKPKQIIIAGAPDSPDTRKMLREVHERFIPHKILMVVGEGRSRETLMRWLPFLKGVTPVKGKATAYICVDYACELPTSDLPTFQAILDGKQPRGG